MYQAAKKDELLSRHDNGNCDGQPVPGAGADFAHIFLAKFAYPDKITILYFETQ